MTSRHPFRSSLYIALRGLIEASYSERNLRIQWSIGGLVFFVGALLRLELREWSLLIICIGMVIAAEIMNTAIEATVDLLSPDHQEQARKAKDFAAGSVLMTSITAAIIGVLILGSRVWQLLSQ